VNDRRVISGIVYVIHHGLQRKDVPLAMAHIRHCITVSSAGAYVACSSGSSQPWQPRPVRRTG
jgi:hypothetical protein